MNTPKTYFHGTSADNLKSILREGLKCDKEKIWQVSDDAIYLWDGYAIAESNCMDDITEENANGEGFRRASESGQFACSKAKDCRIVVLKIELDEDEIEIDYSSENMEGMGARCICRDIAIEEIKEIHVSNDLSLLKGYFLSSAASNSFSNIKLSRIEQKIADVFKNAEIYIDVEELIEFKQLKLKQIQ